MRMRVLCDGENIANCNGRQKTVLIANFTAKAQRTQRQTELYRIFLCVLCVFAVNYFFSPSDELPHIRSKWENCMVNVPLPWVADRMDVEYPNILASGTLARMD